MRKLAKPAANDNTAVAYGRVSSDEQAGNASTRGQQAEAEEYCLNNKLELAHTYFDEARSGKSMEGREQLKRMLNDARAGRFSHLIVWKLTRLSRNLVDTLAIIKELDALGVSVHSITEREYDTSTPAGRMFLHIMASVAEFEREALVENVRMGMKQRAQEGAWIGAEMLGYRVPKEAADTEAVVKAGRLIPVPAEADTVRRIFTLYADGKGLKAITNRLNHEGRKTKRGGFFNPTQVGAILDNPAYIGRVRVRFFDAHSKEDKEYVVDAAHEPIIDRSLWDRAQSLRATKATRPRRVSERGFPLTSILRCPECGAGMSMSRTSNALKNGGWWVRYYYSCGRWKSQGTAVCHQNGIAADVAEKAVFRRLKRTVSHPTLLREIVKRVNASRRESVRPLSQRLALIAKERQKLDAALVRYQRAFESDALDSAEFGRRMAEIKGSLAGLDAEEYELRGRVATSEASGPVSYEVVKMILVGFVDQLQRSDGDRQRVLLRALVKEITFEKGKGIQSIRLHLHEGVALTLGMADTPSITSPVTLTV